MDEVFSKVVRDPIYGYLGLTRAQVNVLQCKVLQRLRRVTQLSFADQVYPNASHSRLAHSLGAMHLGRIVAQYLMTSGLGNELRFADADYEGLIWAGLLHDIGHLPFSHVCEPAFAHFIGRKEKWKDYHEDITQKILCDARFGIVGLVPAEPLGVVVRALAPRQKNAEPKHKLIADAVGASWGMDKLDYLRRDAYHAGIPEYAVIDYFRVLTSLAKHHPRHPRWVPLFKEKSLYALEGVVMSYFYMYRAIYYHHTVRGAYWLFHNTVWEAFENGLQDKLGDIFEPERWCTFDDGKMVALLEEVPEAKVKLDRLRARQLPKPVSGLTEETKMAIHGLLGECSTATKVGCERKVVAALRPKFPSLDSVIIDSPLISPYPSSSLATARALHIWDEKDEHEPRNIANDAKYLAALEAADEQQMAARIYVSPGELARDHTIKEHLETAVVEILATCSDSV